MGFLASFRLGVFALALGACSAPEPSPQPEAQAPLPSKQRLTYGSDPHQFGDLRLPKGAGPHPVVVVMHGGCWFNSYGLDLMDGASEALTAAGLATWNIEYRRIGDMGGGYPNTLTDVGLAVDALRAFAPKYNLDLSKVMTVGHSAGGHLGVWVAARSKLPKGNALRGADPLPIKAAVALAGILDLQESNDLGVCGGAAGQLLGGSSAEFPDRYAEASPNKLLPLGVRQVMVHGTADGIVPIVMSQHYETAAKAAGEAQVAVASIEGADHFDVITPASPKWKQVEAAILEVLP